MVRFLSFLGRFLYLGSLLGFFGSFFVSVFLCGSMLGVLFRSLFGNFLRFLQLSLGLFSLLFKHFSLVLVDSGLMLFNGLVLFVSSVLHDFSSFLLFLLESLFGLGDAVRYNCGFGLCGFMLNVGSGLLDVSVHHLELDSVVLGFSAESGKVGTSLDQSSLLDREFASTTFVHFFGGSVLDRDHFKSSLVL